MARDLVRMLNGLRGAIDGGERITRIVTLSAGHSNETYLLEGLDRILRMPPSEEGLLPPYDMARQHAILSAVAQQPQAVVFLLWGAHAQAKRHLIEAAPTGERLLLTANHPSPLSALRGPVPFMGCRHFSAAQAWLNRRGADFSWNLEN